MLKEFLEKQKGFTPVMPGTQACLFALHDLPCALPLRLEDLHFEAIFCLKGIMSLTRKDDSVLKLGPRQILLLSDLSYLTGVSVEAPLEGILVAVDARNARESLKTICSLMGDLVLDTGQVRRWMSGQGGCTVEGPSHWSRAVFSELDRLPQDERARWCVWKSIELLYLLSASEKTSDTISEPGQDVARTLADTLRYMEEHLDEPLTIPILSRRACLSATSFKESFRRLYGQSVHAWLRQRRMEQAAELLQSSALSVLGVAQSVGYASASQFTAAFRRQYGLTPSQYRKKSESA